MKLFGSRSIAKFSRAMIWSMVASAAPVSVGISMTWPSPAMACELEDLTTAPTGKVTEMAQTNFATLAACIVALKDENRKLQEALDEIAAERAQTSTATAEIPASAVVAFDMPSGCPEGWMDVGKEDSQRFAGRTLVVVGDRVERTNGETTEKRDYNEDGGTEEVLISKNHLPEHRHEINISTSREQHPGLGLYFPEGADTRYYVDNVVVVPAAKETPIKTELEGTGKPLGNMPPYIALHFCKKA